MSFSYIFITKYTNRYEHTHDQWLYDGLFLKKKPHWWSVFEGNKVLVLKCQYELRDYQSPFCLIKATDTTSDGFSFFPSVFKQISTKFLVYENRRAESEHRMDSRAFREKCLFFEGKYIFPSISMQSSCTPYVYTPISRVQSKRASMFPYFIPQW